MEESQHGGPGVGEGLAVTNSLPGLSEQAVSGTVHFLFGRGTGLCHQGKDNRDISLSHLPATMPTLTGAPQESEMRGWRKTIWKMMTRAVPDSPAMSCPATSNHRFICMCLSFIKVTLNDKKIKSLQTLSCWKHAPNQTKPNHLNSNKHEAWA